MALRLGPELPLASVLGEFVDSLTDVPGVQPDEAEHLSRAAIDLVRRLVSAVQSAPRPTHRAREALDATLTLRLVAYLRTHWPEHDVTPDRLASAHQISTRQLHRLLAAQGITLRAWMRKHRLEAGGRERDRRLLRHRQQPGDRRVEHERDLRCPGEQLPRRHHGPGPALLHSPSGQSALPEALQGQEHDDQRHDCHDGADDDEGLELGQP